MQQNQAAGDEQCCATSLFVLHRYAAITPNVAQIEPTAKTARQRFIRLRDGYKLID